MCRIQSVKVGRVVGGKPARSRLQLAESSVSVWVEKAGQTFPIGKQKPLEARLSYGRGHSGESGKCRGVYHNGCKGVGNRHMASLSPEGKDLA